MGRSPFDRDLGVHRFGHLQRVKDEYEDWARCLDAVTASSHRDGVPGIGAVDLAGGRRGEGGLAGGSAQALPAVGAKAGDVGLQWDWSDGPRIGPAVLGRGLPSSGWVVTPAWGQQLGTLIWCLD